MEEQDGFEPSVRFLHGHLFSRQGPDRWGQLLRLIELGGLTIACVVTVEVVAGNMEIKQDDYRHI